MSTTTSRRRRALVPAGIAFAAVVVGCVAAVVGGLSVTASGLPAGASAEVDVTGPNGYSETLETPGTLTSLPVGEYVLTPRPVSVANAGFVGEEVFGADPEQVEVKDGETAEADIAYAFAGSVVPDAAGDAVGTSVSEPHYDLVETGTRVVGDVLEVYLAVDPSQTDLSFFVGLVGIDVDQDPATGETGTYHGYCTPPGDGLGFEFELDFEPGAAYLYDTGEDGIDIELVPEFAGSTVTIPVPLAALGGDARVDVAAVVGSFAEPTDCSVGEFDAGVDL